MCACARNQRRWAGNISGKRVGDASLLAQVFRAVGEAARVGVSTSECGEERGERLGRDAIVGGFSDGRRFVGGEYGEHLGEVGGSERQGIGNDVDFLLLRRVSATNRSAQVGANGKLPGPAADLFE